MHPPAFPTPVGVFHAKQRPTYDEAMNSQIASARSKPADLDALFTRGDTWTVE
jgi:2-oxoglutarate ferredoxin oxidoreductase subunit beta